MMYTDEELQTLREQFCNKSSVENKLKTLRIKLAELEGKIKHLEAAMKKEQEDVDKLEKVSLSSFFYSITGRKAEQLNKERDEAYAAALKYEAAYKEYNSVRENIEWLEGRLVKMADYKREYERAIAEKLDALKETGNSAGDEIKRVETMLCKIMRDLKELDEAIDACDKTRVTADKLVTAFEDAEAAADIDFHAGGRRGIHNYKYGRLDAAQAYINTLQVQLGKLKTELSDVTVPSEIRVEISSFECFADRFFDSFITDWVVLDKIRKSLEQARSVKEKINAVYYRLTVLREELNADRSDVKAQLDKLIMNSKI